MKKNQETSWIYQFHLSLFQIIALHCIAFVLWPELLNNFRCPDVFRQRKNKHQFNVKLILEARENTFFHIDLRQFSPLLRFPIKTHKRMQIRPQNIYDSICICGRLVFCIRLGVCYFLFSLEISILFEYFVQWQHFLWTIRRKNWGLDWCRSFNCTVFLILNCKTDYATANLFSWVCVRSTINNYKKSSLLTTVIILQLKRLLRSQKAITSRLKFCSIFFAGRWLPLDSPFIAQKQRVSKNFTYFFQDVWPDFFAISEFIPRFDGEKVNAKNSLKYHYHKIDWFLFE